MKLQCEVVFLRTSAANSQVQKASRAQRAFAVIEKVKILENFQACKYRVAFAVHGDTNKNKFELSPPPRLMTPFMSQGKATLAFRTTPKVQVLISKAQPDRLKEFITLIQKIVNGNEEINLDSQPTVKKSDFKPVAIRIKDQEDYKKHSKNFADHLEEIVLEPIDLRMPDRRWASFTHLQTLILDGNPFASRGRNLDVFSGMTSLRRLHMNLCRLGDIPQKDLWTIFLSLPSTIAYLDISSNRLTKFPPIFHLKSIRFLKCNHNPISYLSSRITCLPELHHFEMENNLLPAIPDVGLFRRIMRLHLDGNVAVYYRRAEVPEGDFRVLTKCDRVEYCPEGGVDSLTMIAANAVHRSDCLMKLAGGILPLDLQFRTHDLLNEEPMQTSVDLCSGCERLRHIRAVRRHTVASRDIAQIIDLVSQYVAFDKRYCIDCLRRRQYGRRHLILDAPTWPINPDYFELAP